MWRGMSADDAAAHWLVMRGGPHWSDADKAAFDQWLAEADAHRRAMARAEQAWAVFDVPDDEGFLESMRRSALAVDRAPSLMRLRALAAACVMAVMLAGMAWLGTGGRIVLEAHRNTPSTVQVAGTEHDPLMRRGAADFTTVRGQRADVTLPDGTLMTLDTDSALDVAFERDRRVVYLLKGRAYFDVAHNPARPFVVEADDRQVTAIGTQFDVRLDPSSLQVLLISGRVHVDHNRVMAGDAKWERDVDLRPGDRLTVTLGKAMSIDRVADTTTETLWRRGLVQFDEAPLSEAVTELNRYATEPLVIRDPAVSDLRISGVFRTGDPARFARLLSDLLPVQVIQADSGEKQLVMARSRR